MKCTLDGWAESPWTSFNRDILEDGIDMFIIEFHNLDNWVSVDKTNALTHVQHTIPMFFLGSINFLSSYEMTDQRIAGWQNIRPENVSIQGLNSIDGRNDQ